MEKLITIFIPSYNRAIELDVALQSIFCAINKSPFGSLVEVLVVDDYSKENVFRVIRKHRNKGNKVTFKRHRKKCGVAEIAMLRCLDFIDTKYAWCIGNDDAVISDSLDHLIPILLNSNSSFFLLNLFGKETDGFTYEYFSSSQTEIIFANGAQFFENFGFVTSTTTFPCLCFEVDHLKRIDLEYILSISPIYSHTSAFYCAFYDSQCSFIPKPLVIFNHNEMETEHHKLENCNKVFNKPGFYHACVGLGKHLEYITMKTGVELKRIANSAEDEIHKHSKEIKKSITIFFIFAFTMQQMRHEISSYNGFGKNSLCLTLEDIEFLQHLFADCGRSELGDLFLLARGIYCSQSVKPGEKLRILQSIANKSFALEGKAYDQLLAHKEKIGYLVYGQRNGIKRLITSRAKRKKMNIGLVHCRLPTPQQLRYVTGKYIVACEMNSIDRSMIADLNDIAEVTKSDIVVFNTFLSSEDFFKIFCPTLRSCDAPNDLTTWTRKDLSLEEMISMIDSSASCANSQLLYRSTWLNAYYGNNNSVNPLIEFVNYGASGARFLCEQLKRGI